MPDLSESSDEPDEPDEPGRPRHRARTPYPNAEDLLSSMPPLRRADILALLRPPEGDVGFDWFESPPVGDRRDRD